MTHIFSWREAGDGIRPTHIAWVTIGKNPAFRIRSDFYSAKLGLILVAVQEMVTYHDLWIRLRKIYYLGAVPFGTYQVVAWYHTQTPDGPSL
jgi:hypothetical protein